MKILVIGGTRYFGKRFVHLLLQDGHEVTVMSRGQTQDDFGARVKRLHVDRNDEAAFLQAVQGKHWDAVVDQICMTSVQAEIAIKALKEKAAYYLLTSTMSVYPFRANVTEEDFNSLLYTPTKPQSPGEEYAEGKRAAEQVFAKQSSFKWSAARFPMVLGEDDYTERLWGQIQKVRKGAEIYYPNLEAKMGFITSEDAAKSLYWLVKSQREGSYNFATHDVVSMADLMGMIEEVVGKKVQWAQASSSEVHSPFGIPSDWYMNVEKAKNEGFEAKSLKTWLRNLIESLAAKA